MKISDPLQRALLSLQGLALGDALGGFFEFSHGRLSRRITERIVPQGIWHWTDDTQMALSLYALLRRTGKIDPDVLAASLVEHYERSRGYGRSVRAMIQRVRNGADWRESARQIFGEQGSYGNGCASRVAPLGAFFADDLDQVIEQARRSAIVTHHHPEAVAGTNAVACAAAWVCRLADQPISPADLLDKVIACTPESAVRAGLMRARELGPDCELSELVATLGNGMDATVQTTVPFELWCAAHQLDSYEEAIWLTLAGQGDCDTTCAIVGGIVALRTGMDSLPAAWRASCEALPEWALND